MLLALQFATKLELIEVSLRSTFCECSWDNRLLLPEIARPLGPCLLGTRCTGGFSGQNSAKLPGIGEYRNLVREIHSHSRVVFSLVTSGLASCNFNRHVEYCILSLSDHSSSPSVCVVAYQNSCLDDLSSTSSRNSLHVSSCCVW